MPLQGQSASIRSTARSSAPRPRAITMSATGAVYAGPGRNHAADGRARGGEAARRRDRRLTSWSTPAWSPARSRCRRTAPSPRRGGGFPVERGELHGGGHRGRADGDGRAARRTLECGRAGGADLSHLPQLRTVRRPPRGSEAAYRRRCAGCTARTWQRSNRRAARNARWRRKKNDSRSRWPT